MDAPFDAVAEVSRLSGLPRDGRGRIDLRLIDATGAIDALERIEALVAHLHAVQADLLITAAGIEPTTDEFEVDAIDPTLAADPTSPDGLSRTVRIVDATRDEIAAALRWSNAFTYSRIDQARLLHTHLPATLQALRAGEVSPSHVRVITETAARFSHRDARNEFDRASFAASCASLEARVLPIARSSTVSRTQSASRRLASRLDRDAQRRRAAAQRTRDVSMHDEGDGIACVIARLSTPAAHALLDAVQRHSTSIVDQSLSAGERRAQALMSLVFGETAPQVRLNVVVSARREPGSLDEREALRIVASLRGADVDAQSLHELIKDPRVTVTMRKLVTDDVTGQLTACGRTTYRLPVRLRAFIVERDQTCRFPGCARRAERCQVDHAIAWEAGGSTDPGNLGALCVRHHQLKTHGGWRIVASEPDGSCTWQSPQGRRYRRHAPAVQGVVLESRLARILATARGPAQSDVKSLAGHGSHFHGSDPPPF